MLSVRVILEDEEPGFRKFNTASALRERGGQGHQLRGGPRRRRDQHVDLQGAGDQGGAGGRSATRSPRASCSSRRRATTARKSPTPRASRPTPTRPPFPGWSRWPRRTGGCAGRRSPTGTPRFWWPRPAWTSSGAGPGDEYWVGRGTSQATALVSGVAALIKAKYPKMSPALVAQALDRGRDPAAQRAATTPAPASASSTPPGRSPRRRGSPGTPSRPRARGSYDPARPLGKAIEPVQVVHRDQHKITLYAGVAVAAGLGAVASLAMMALFVGRMRSANRFAKPVRAPVSTH